MIDPLTRELLHEQILETQQALVAAKAEDNSRGSGPAGADVRRWTGLRNLVEARALLKTLFRSAAQLRAQVPPAFIPAFLFSVRRQYRDCSLPVLNAQPTKRRPSLPAFS